MTRTKNSCASDAQEEAPTVRHVKTSAKAVAVKTSAKKSAKKSDVPPHMTWYKEHPCDTNGDLLANSEFRDDDGNVVPGFEFHPTPGEVLPACLKHLHDGDFISEALIKRNMVVLVPWIMKHVPEDATGPHAQVMRRYASTMKAKSSAKKSSTSSADKELNTWTFFRTLPWAIATLNARASARTKAKKVGEEPNPANGKANKNADAGMLYNSGDPSSAKNEDGSDIEWINEDGSSFTDLPDKEQLEALLVEHNAGVHKVSVHKVAKKSAPVIPDADADHSDAPSESEAEPEAEPEDTPAPTPAKPKGKPVATSTSVVAL